MKKTSILIVDDDESILATLSAILKGEGYDIDTAKNGKEAIEKSKSRFFNVALLDIRLPDMEGTGLLTTMHGSVPKMVKIMLTGYPSLKNAIEALNLGADAYVIKPVDPEKLIRIIKDNLKNQREAEKMSQERAIRWVKTRLKRVRGRRD